MKTTAIFIFTLLFAIGLQAQIETGDILGGAIKFLTTNPKTANRMKPGEKVALNLVGELFKTQAERRHDSRVAFQGKDQININYGNGTASIVRDANGNMYLLFEGTIYPISKEFIGQALQTQTSTRTLSINYLPGYNEKDLQKKYLKRKVNIFLFSYYHDDNMNQCRDFEEFHGKNRNFKKGDFNVFIGHFFRNKKTTVWSQLEVVNSSGRVVARASQKDSGLFGYGVFWFKVSLYVPGDYLINVLISEINEKGKTIGTSYLKENVRIF